MKRNLYKGFTLAETLIALSVVGIIAMMTLPSLITNHNENILNKASELFQARVKDAMNVMWQTGKLEGILSTEEFVEELEKNMNLANKCSNSNLTNCFVETINTDNNPIETSTLKKSSHFGHKDYDTTTMGLRTNFGVNAIIAFDKYCEIPADAKEIGMPCVSILADLNGNKEPNRYGKDIRGINIAKLGNECAIKLNGKCFGTPFFTGAMSYTTCAGENATSAGTATEAGTYAKSLGIKECYNEEDFWAGAVEACGSVDKLPNESDLTVLAQQLYPTISVTNTDITGCDTNDHSATCRDTETAFSLGFMYPSGTLTSSDSFYVWSGIENSSYIAYARVFDPTHTTRYSSRSEAGFMVMCLGE
ncbi:type II secretion system protein [bacterium]|nr:type II secretion system protein [bacterium]